MQKRNNEKESLPWHFKLNIKYLLQIDHFNGFDTIFNKKPKNRQNRQNPNDSISKFPQNFTICWFWIHLFVYIKGILLLRILLLGFCVL